MIRFLFFGRSPVSVENPELLDTPRCRESPVLHKFCSGPVKEPQVFGSRSRVVIDRLPRRVREETDGHLRSVTSPIPSKCVKWWKKWLPARRKTLALISNDGRCSRIVLAKRARTVGPGPSLGLGFSSRATSGVKQIQRFPAKRGAGQNHRKTRFSSSQNETD
jgi:hypothetical protein